MTAFELRIRIILHKLRFSYTNRTLSSWHCALMCFIMLLTVYGKTLDDNYMHILYDHPELNLQDAFLLDRVQKGVQIEKKDADRLRALKLVEGRLGSLYLSASVAKSIEDQAGYIKNKGLDDQYYKTLIIEYLKQYSKANRKEINKLLWDKLPDLLLSLIHI